jgi:anti-sigma B factor antagonist
MRVTVHHAEDAIVVTVTGELDYATAPRLCTIVEASTARLSARALVIDLSGLEFLGSAGLAALVDIRRTLGPALRVVVGTERRVIRPIQLTGLDQLLHLFPGVKDALAAP